MKRVSYDKLTDILLEQNKGTGLFFSIAYGKMLDRYAAIYGNGLKRKRWWIFKESDRSFKARLLYHEMVKQGFIEGE